MAFNTSIRGITLFTIISIGYVLGQLFLMKLLDSSSSALKARSTLISALHKSVTIIQYLLAANVILVIIQILLFSKYSTISLLFVTYISNFVTGALLFIFALRFISWYKDKKQSIGILLFALSFFILATSEIISGLGSGDLLMQKGSIITPESKVQFIDHPEGSFYTIVFHIYHYVDYVAFLLTLIGSSLLLYHYSRKTNAPKMILIIALPILGYTSTILDALNIYNTDTNPDLFSFYIFQKLVSISTGALFAFSFWIILRRLPDSSIKTFLKLTAYGFILLYISNHVSVNTASYPPYGINSLSLLPLSAYFVLFGLYSSALSLSQDITLRQHLRALAKNDNNLLSSIGTAQMESEVKRAVGELKDVVNVQEKELAEKTGIETPVPESEIEDYLKQVIEEVSKARKK